MGGRNFTGYVEQILAPTVKKGDIVFMDRVRLHMLDGVEEAVGEQQHAVARLASGVIERTL